MLKKKEQFTGESDMGDQETQPDKLPQRRPVRLWPGVVAVILLWLIRFGVPLVFPEALEFAVIAGVVGGLAIVIWWLFFSRAPRLERWGAVLLMIVAMLATSLILHESIATGAMGMLFPIYAIPVLSLAFVAWAVASRSLSDGPRRLTMVATILIACGGWGLVRTGGITGDLDSDFAWRWSQTPEERLLAEADDEPMGIESAALSAVPEADWPGFRGPHRDSIVRGVRIATDWTISPPVELWRRLVGPGWSSFSVGGDLLYTQEQRGDDEVVACYRVSTGEPVWKHRDPARFWESNAGAGPRATPFLSKARVYTFGATGILNVLDAGDGTVFWSRNAALDTGSEVPTWGFASSPLVVDDVVIVAVGGALAAYDLATGELRWRGPHGGTSYSSPHSLKIHGVEQVLLLSEKGAISVAPADGRLLWEHPWPGDTRIVQPAVTEGNDILIGSSPIGTRRISVAHGPDGWTTEERWTSIRLKPNYNDFVIHNGHAYGFDGGILACMDVEDGKRMWKGGRYGHGQLVLLADQGLLLVVSEQGELVLVRATPERFTELAKSTAIEGKTWNHPVLVANILLVRNGEEMAAFQLSLAGG
jgi:outer membrane protein assembly factor BamB